MRVQKGGIFSQGNFSLTALRSSPSCIDQALAASRLPAGGPFPVPIPHPMSHALSFVRCGVGLVFTISYRTTMQGRQTDLSFQHIIIPAWLAPSWPQPHHLLKQPPLSHAWPYGRTISRAVSTPVHAGGPAQEADSGHARVSSFLGFIESSGSDDLCGCCAPSLVPCRRGPRMPLALTTATTVQEPPARSSACVCVCVSEEVG
jgi:hypothetical protein